MKGRMTESGCSIVGLPWEAPTSDVLSFVGAQKRVVDLDEDHPADMCVESDVVLLRGGRHDGQRHILPVGCGEWQCGQCGEAYR